MSDNNWSTPRHFAIRNNLERFGFAFLLSDRMGVRRPKRSFRVTWQHGIYSHQDRDCLLPYLVSSNATETDLVVVGSPRDLRFVVRHGVKNVIVGGLPFAYTSPMVERKGKRLLAFPAHSSDAAGEQVVISEEYLEYLEAQRKDFEIISISAFGLDAEQSIYKTAMKMGFSVLPGANPTDANSLYRVRAMLDSHSHVTTNTVGSTVFYALSVGCQVSVCGPLYDYRKTERRMMDLQKVNSDELLSSYTFGGQFSIKEVQGFFAPSPNYGIKDRNLGLEAIGSDFVIHDRDVLTAMLRWGMGAQVNGYLRGGLKAISQINLLNIIRGGRDYK